MAGLDQALFDLANAGHVLAVLEQTSESGCWQHLVAATAISADLMPTAGRDCQKVQARLPLELIGPVEPKGAGAGQTG